MGIVYTINMVSFCKYTWVYKCKTKASCIYVHIYVHRYMCTSRTKYYSQNIRGGDFELFPFCTFIHFSKFPSWYNISFLLSIKDVGHQHM